MDTPDAAIEIALRHLENPSWEPAVTKVEDADGSWRVFYNTRIYVETREVSHALAGNLPLLIDKRSGDVTLDLSYMSGSDHWRS